MSSTTTTTDGPKEQTVVYDLIANFKDPVWQDAYKTKKVAHMIVAVMFAVPGVSIQCTSTNKHRSLVIASQIKQIIQLSHSYSECIIKCNEEELVVIPPEHLRIWLATENHKQILETASRIQFTVSS